MNVRSLEQQPPVVYLSPQAINPLSASKEPIALALAVVPHPSAADKAANNATSAHKTPGQVVDKVQSIKRPTAVVPDATGSAFTGKVDVYV